MSAAETLPLNGESAPLAVVEPMRLRASQDFVPPRQSVYQKLVAAKGALPAVVMSRKDNRQRAYADNDDITAAVAPALIAQGLDLSSDIVPASIAMTLGQRRASDKETGESWQVETVRITLTLTTTITDVATGEQITYSHPGIGEDDTGENAIKQASTIAKGIMYRSIFPLKFVKPGNAPANEAGNASPSKGAQKTPALSGQIARIKTLAGARGIELGSDQMRELLRAASKGYAKGIGEDQMSYGDAENLIKALEAIPMPAGASRPQTATVEDPVLLAARGAAKEAMGFTGQPTAEQLTAMRKAINLCLGAARRSVGDFVADELNAFAKARAFHNDIEATLQELGPEDLPRFEAALSAEVGEVTKGSARGVRYDFRALDAGEMQRVLEWLTSEDSDEGS